MTELLLDEAFYKAEVRADYYVSEEMNIYGQLDSIYGSNLIQFAGNII